MNEPVGAIPSRLCDVVMKGGITSGVVYPLTICELSNAFRFKNLGGTSAGAIAAAAAAAAELGRYRNTGGGFQQLAQLPEFLASKPGGGRTTLFALFQPQPSTRRLFDVCVAGLGGGRAAVGRVVLTACRRYWFIAILGALPGLFLWLSCPETGALAILARVVALAVAVVGGLLTVGIGLARTAVREIPRNLFGLTSGMPGAPVTSQQALTPWLTSYLDELAGCDPNGAPLTFGDLWTAGNTQPSGDTAINLEMITTCLTHGRPYRLPFRDDENTRDNRQFFFRCADFERLFPERVVAWMQAHPRAASDDHAAADEARYRDAGFIPLPEPADLPVVVAVRMSLSFPVLLSAVPLYAVDRSRTKVVDPLPERCWFSDGGISSNFPVHFFDTALPRWPTFAIDLTEKHPDHDAGFYMPNTNAAGTLVKWRRFDTGTSLQRLFGFLAGIVMTAKDWTDNAQCRLPGFRDRIGQVSLSPGDGGLNLDMPSDRIARLSGYGHAAGATFVKRFATADPGSVLDWKNHRHVRLRTALAAVEHWLGTIGRSVAQPQPGDASYSVLTRDPAPPSYTWENKQQQAAAAQLLDDLQRVAQSLSTLSTSSVLWQGSPRPHPEIRMRPRI